ncbi:MAG: hypothetical protein KKH40_03840 [Nanoarchaeota archaeon]|nr:hypothetical protein [Nanoarchaeota archaeon]
MVGKRGLLFILMFILVGSVFAVNCDNDDKDEFCYHHDGHTYCNGNDKAYNVPGRAYENGGDNSRRNDVCWTSLVINEAYIVCSDGADTTDGDIHRCDYAHPYCSYAANFYYRAGALKSGDDSYAYCCEPDVSEGCCVNVQNKDFVWAGDHCFGDDFFEEDYVLSASDCADVSFPNGLWYFETKRGYRSEELISESTWDDFSPVDTADVQRWDVFDESFETNGDVIERVCTNHVGDVLSGDGLFNAWNSNNPKGRYLFLKGVTNIELSLESAQEVEFQVRSATDSYSFFVYEIAFDGSKGDLVGNFQKLNPVDDMDSWPVLLSGGRYRLEFYIYTPEDLLKFNILLVNKDSLVRYVHVIPEGYLQNEFFCNDGSDNDFDGFVDMADNDCFNNEIICPANAGYYSLQSLRDGEGNPSALNGSDGCCGDDLFGDFAFVDFTSQFFCSKDYDANYKKILYDGFGSWRWWDATKTGEAYKIHTIR